MTVKGGPETTSDNTSPFQKDTLHTLNKYIKPNAISVHTTAKVQSHGWRDATLQCGQGNVTVSRMMLLL